MDFRKRLKKIMVFQVEQNEKIRWAGYVVRPASVCFLHPREVRREIRLSLACHSLSFFLFFSPFSHLFRLSLLLMHWQIYLEGIHPFFVSQMLLSLVGQMPNPQTG